MPLPDEFKRFIERTGDKYMSATLGAKIGGTYTLHVPGKLGYVFVTTGGNTGFGGGFDVARGYKGGSPGMPVRLRVRNGVAEIVSADYGQLPAYSPGSTVVPGTVPFHNHAIGGGMTDPVQGLRFIPGLVRPYQVAGSFGLVVWIEPIFYKHQGTLKYFAGQAFDLTSYVPGTASKKAWVVVGIDPATNTPTATTGTEYALAVTMTPALLQDFAFAGQIPLGAVVLKNGQTAINNIGDFTDVRPYVSAAVDTGSLSLDANAGWPSTTAKCADATKTEYTTNDVDLISLDFDQASAEYAQWSVWMPADWNGGTVTATFAWTAQSGSGTVVWAAQGRAYANDDAIDQAWGTAQTVTDTLLATGDMHITSATSAITLAGSPAGGQFVQFRIYRDATSDTLNADAQLLSVNIQYTRG